ncbi:hypothetical protein [Nonomuraea maritima]|uniref:hypothetical protein n=1 Tax=Nonomuraea maritima TaxID=683260 RepID=UPI00371AE7B8
MKTRTVVAAGILAIATLTATAQAAVADTPEPAATTTPAASQEQQQEAAKAPVSTVPTAQHTAECGKVTLTFTNPTKWEHTFDYRVDSQRAKYPPVSNIEIKEGPYQGKKFGWRYNPVKVAPQSSKTVEVPFRSMSGTHKVSYWLQQGPEQKWFLAPVTVDVKTFCSSRTEAPTFKQPRCSDKDAHIDVKAVTGVRYYYQSGRHKQALVVGDNKVRAGSSGVVLAVKTSKSVILRGKTSWPVKFDKAPSTYTCS